MQDSDKIVVDESLARALVAQAEAANRPAAGYKDPRLEEVKAGMVAIGRRRWKLVKVQPKKVFAAPAPSEKARARARKREEAESAVLKARVIENERRRQLALHPARLDAIPVDTAAQAAVAGLNEILAGQAAMLGVPSDLLSVGPHSRG